jgi:hypothetical protein
LVDIQTNKVEDPFGWRVKVEKQVLKLFKKNLNIIVKTEKTFLGFFVLFCKLLLLSHFDEKSNCFFSFVVISCAKNTQVHPPVGGFLPKKDLEVSKNRTKNLNLMERSQIQDWINHQNEKFYSTGLNYWINIDDFEQRTKKRW